MMTYHEEHMTILANSHTWQESVVQRFGEVIWDEICNNVLIDRPFVPKDLVGKIPLLSGYKEDTQRTMVKIVLYNVIAEWREKDHAPVAIHKRKGQFILTR